MELITATIGLVVIVIAFFAGFCYCMYRASREELRKVSETIDQQMRNAMMTAIVRDYLEKNHYVRKDDCGKCGCRCGEKGD